MKFKEFFTGTPEEKGAKDEIERLQQIPDGKFKARHRKQLGENIDITRRLFLRQTGTAGAVVAGGGLVYFFSDDEEVPEPKPEEAASGRVAKKKPTIRKRHDAVGNAKYEKWASKIELPTFEFSDETLSKKEIDDHLLDKIDKEKLEKFYDVYDGAKKELLANRSKGEVDEQKLVRKFGSEVFNALVQYVPYEEFSDKEHLGSLSPEDLRAHLDDNLPLYFNAMNQYLIPRDEFIDLTQLDDPHPKPGIRFQPPAPLNNLRIFDIEKTKSAAITMKDEKLKVPIVDLGDGIVHIGGKMEHDTDPTSAQYLNRINTAIMSMMAARDNKIIITSKLELARMAGLSVEGIDVNAVCDDYDKTTLIHEAIGHASYFNLILSNPDDEQPLKNYNKGDIAMGNHTIPSWDIEMLKKQSVDSSVSLMLSEAYACGIGLMNSNESAKFVVIDMVLGGVFGGYRPYSFAATTMLNEIATYSNQPLNPNNFTEADFVKVVFNIPDEDLRKMGEKMAKLVVYLIQSEQSDSQE